jgi:acetyl esterase/lipase
LIAGSGPTDRDWNNPYMPSKNGSGRLLAAELAGRGVVVLRYDKMGSGKFDPPAKLPIVAEDLEVEPRMAFAFLRGRVEVDPDRVFAAGHSEGGTYAIRLVTAPLASPAAGLLLLASAGRPIKDLLLDQVTTQARAEAVENGHDPAILDEDLASVRKDVDDFFAGKDVDVGKYQRVLKVFAALFAPVSAPATRGLYGYDPVSDMRRLRGRPVFIGNGEKDKQVSPTKDAQRLADAARAAGADVTLFLAPQADHVLKHEERPLETITPETIDYNAEGRALDPALLAAIVTWLRAHT